MRTKKVQAPKPITLGILESLEYMNNGHLPRRNSRSYHIAGELLGYCLLILLVVGALHYALKILPKVMA